MRQRPLAGSVLLECRHGEMDTDARVLRGLHARTHASTHKSANIRAAERTARTQSAHEESFVNQSGNKRRESSIVSRGYLHYISGRDWRFAQSSEFIKASEKQLTHVCFFFVGAPLLRHCVSDPL